MQMTPDNWDRTKELFEAALELDSTQRVTFLAENCREESLRQQVEKLLINYEEAGSFLDDPVLSPRIPAPNGVAESQIDEASHLDSISVDLLATVTSTEAEDPMVGRQLGDYKLVRRIGQGGMGAVYKARQKELDRVVALQILPPKPP